MSFLHRRHHQIGVGRGWLEPHSQRQRSPSGRAPVSGEAVGNRRRRFRGRRWPPGREFRGTAAQTIAERVTVSVILVTWMQDAAIAVAEHDLCRNLKGSRDVKAKY